jgi:O-antigen/teichoic acid export membrane protein
MATVVSKWLLLLVLLLAIPIQTVVAQSDVGNNAPAQLTVDDLRSVFDRGRKPLFVLTGWVLTLFIAGGQPLIDLLYDPRYRGAGLVVQSLAVASWFHMLEVVNGSALKALGSPKWLAVATAVKIAVLSIGLPLGVWLGGMSGGLVALVIGDAVKWLVSSYAMSRHQLPVWRAVLPTTGWVGVSAGLTSALVAWSEWGPSRALLMVLVVASSCWAVPGWRTLRALR